MDIVLVFCVRVCQTIAFSILQWANSSDLCWHQAQVSKEICLTSRAWTWKILEDWTWCQTKVDDLAPCPFNFSVSPFQMQDSSLKLISFIMKEKTSTELLVYNSSKKLELVLLCHLHNTLPLVKYEISMMRENVFRWYSMARNEMHFLD